MNTYTITTITISDEEKRILDRAFTVLYYLKELTVVKRVANGDTIYELIEEIKERLTELCELLDHDIARDLGLSLELQKAIDANCT